MSELTKEDYKSMWELSERRLATSEELRTGLALKLQSLSQEAVRDEALAEALACPRPLVMREHACKNRKQCWEPCGDLGHHEEYALKREPNAATQDNTGLEDRPRGTERLPNTSGPAPAAPSSSPGIPSDGTIYEGTAPQGASALNEMEGSTLTHAVAAAPVAEMVKRLRDYRCADPWAGALMIEAATLLARPGQGWIPVSERLPEDGAKVLIFHDDSQHVMNFHANEKEFWEEDGTWFIHLSGITHWMPLPPAP